MISESGLAQGEVLAWKMTLTESSTKRVSDAKLDIKRTEVWRAWANVCTRICARTTRFLLIGRECDDDCEKSRFTLVNRLSFETKRNVLKSTISQS